FDTSFVESLQYQGAHDTFWNLECPVSPLHLQQPPCGARTATTFYRNCLSSDHLLLRYISGAVAYRRTEDSNIALLPKAYHRTAIKDLITSRSHEIKDKPGRNPHLQNHRIPIRCANIKIVPESSFGIRIGNCQVNTEGGKEIQNQAYGNQYNFTDMKLKLQTWFGIRAVEKSSVSCAQGLVAQCLLLMFRVFNKSPCSIPQGWTLAA
ncbi:hypothetical protein STEG23_007804, partial [Scotinomys teguina]